MTIPPLQAAPGKLPTAQALMNQTLMIFSPSNLPKARAGVTLAPGGIQDERVGRARVSAPGVQLAQQQLVEQGCVQAGVAHPVGGGCGGFLGQRGRDSGSQCQHQGRQPQQGPCSGGVGLKARMALGGHRFIIMEGVCALCDPGQ